MKSLKYSSYLIANKFELQNSLQSSLIDAQSKSNVFSYLGNNNNYYAFLIYFILATPMARNFLEQFMITHMLVQIPLLVICGGWIANNLANKYSLHIPYHFALPLLVIALTTAMYWMLPKTLDASLEDILYEYSKFISLPICVGAAFNLGWKNVGPITKSFLITNLLCMFVVLAWLYIEAPVRLCNFYLVDEHKQVGMYMLYAVTCISLYYLVKLFIGSSKQNNSNG